MKTIKHIITVLILLALTTCASGGKSGDDSQKGNESIVKMGMAVLSGHTAIEQSYGNIAYSPDGLRVATVGKDRTVKVWNFEDERLLRTFQLDNSASWISWSRNGRHLVAAYSTEIREGIGRNVFGYAYILDTYNGRINKTFWGGGSERGGIVTGINAVFSWDSVEIVVPWNEFASSYVTKRSPLEIIASTSNKRSFERASGMEWLSNERRWRGFSSITAAGKDLYAVTLKNEGLTLYSTKIGLIGSTIPLPFDADCLLAVSPDGKLAAAAAKTSDWKNLNPDTPRGAQAQTVYVYNLSSRAEIGTYRISIGIVRDVRFNKDSSQLLVDTTNAETVVFNLASKEIVDTIDRHYMERQFGMSPEVIAAIAWSKDGSRLAVVKSDNALKENRVSIWDMASARMINTFPISLRTPAEEAAFNNSDNRAVSVALSPDGTEVTVGMYPGYLRTYNLAAGKPVNYFENGSALYNRSSPPIMQAVYSPDGRSLLVINGKFKDAKVNRMYRNKVAMPGIPAGSYEIGYPIKPFVSGIAIMDKASGRRISELVNFDQQDKLSGDDTEQFRNAVFSPDGRFAAAAGFRNLRIWDAASGNVQRTYRISETYRFEQDLVEQGANGPVLVEAFIYEPKAAGSTLAFSRDGSLLAVGGHGIITLFDMKANKELRKFEFPTQRIQFGNYPMAAVAVSADNKRVMALNDQGVLRVWDAATGELIRRITIQADNLNSRTAVFSPDGSRLALITTTYSIEVWDILSGEQAFLTIYTPEQWSAVASSGRSWNASELGRRYVGYINKTGEAEPVKQVSGDTGMLQEILTGKSDGEHLARRLKERQADEDAQTKKEAEVTIKKGTYTFDLGSIEDNSKAYIEKIVVLGSTMTVFIGGIPEGWSNDRMKGAFILRNLGNDKAWHAVTTAVLNGSHIFIFKVTQGTYFSLTSSPKYLLKGEEVPKPEHTFPYFYFGQPDK